MSGPIPPVRAVTLDFYQTLVDHRAGIGRGRALMEYLEAHGLRSAPWEHQVLYDVLGRHDTEYDPKAPREERERYYRRLARRLFRRLEVAAPIEEADRRASDVWELVGPASLVVFDDVPGALVALEDAGYPLAVVSNWQRGLTHFCAELGLAEHFDHVLASAEVGSQKPDPGIFLEACRRLGVPPSGVVQVGDGVVDDIEGGRGAGVRVVLMLRGEASPPPDVTTVSSLAELPPLLASWTP